MAFLLLLAQIAIEGARWQLAPSYLALPLLGLAVFSRKATEDEQARKRMCRDSLVLIIGSALLAIVVPIPNLPAPTGPYAVGTQFYWLKDSSRRELYASDPLQMRELAIQVWYPADSTATAPKATYMPSSNSLSPFLAAPLFALAASHLHLIPTHSTCAAPVSPAEAKYPVLIFSHGLMGGRIQNTVQAEELASHGFIVVGIDHTYDASFAIFSDRTVCSQLLAGSPPSVPKLLNGNSDLLVRLADVSFVLDQLEQFNQSDPQGLLTERLALEQIGVYGHSLGGQTAILSCVRDRRFKAGLAMDGSIGPRSIALNQPFMFMQADRSGDPLWIAELCRHLKAPHYNIKLKGTEHANFTDLPLLTPVHWLALMSGPTDGKRAIKVINSYSVAFFGRYLKGERSPLLEGDARAFPEAVLQISDGQRSD
jgi:predicted dienelactone hydrolase